ncbi:cell division control protein Ccd6 (plasmid) [Halobiforma lacisalsi AJ5]|uniref:ORC1-type DNA replication protein n=1 Tax=Natronobacterium lacisalsi AJ5 TaxID=358396 RepID=A0A1P8LWJ4_NATLA|nr:AAA family ATPase [Halobiforma lacisalsi]APX00176.1 cell division control protein Ccd6 [Halobiforma lacisalsi AJ5]
MGIFDNTDPLVQDFDVLNPSIEEYTPEDLPERREQLSEIESLYQPVVTGGAPFNCFVYGPTGQGKTVAVRLKTSEVARDAREEGIDFHYVHVGCKGCDKSYHVLVQLVRELKIILEGPGVDKPKGYNQKDLFDMAMEKIEEIGGYVIIVLDEIDAIGDDQYVLYELAEATPSNAKLGLICITNDTQFRQNLDADVRSRIGSRKIQFAPYNAHHLINILSRRAVMALRDTEFVGLDERSENESLRHYFESDVLTEEVIPRVAAIAANETGDARHAIEIFQRTCELAMREQAEVITEEHVELAKQKIEQDAIRNSIESESQQRKLALLSVIKAELKDETPAETRELHSIYRTLTTQGDFNQLVQPVFREKLNDLYHSNILAKDKYGRGRGDGYTNSYELVVDLDLALETLAADETQIAEFAKMLDDYR